MGRAFDQPEHTFVVLLRGVNVGGVRMRMVDVCALLEDAGFRPCASVLASGNLVFRSRLTASEARSVVEALLAEAYGYPARALVLDAPALARHLAATPFAQTAERHSYVVFASDSAVLAEAATRAAESAAGSDVDRVAAGDGALYWNVVKGHSTTSPVAKALARSFAGAVNQNSESGTGFVTTRGATTLQKILVKCEALSPARG